MENSEKLSQMFCLLCYVRRRERKLGFRCWNKIILLPLDVSQQQASAANRRKGIYRHIFAIRASPQSKGIKCKSSKFTDDTISFHDLSLLVLQTHSWYTTETTREFGGVKISYQVCALSVIQKAILIWLLMRYVRILQTARVAKANNLEYSFLY